MKKTLATLFVAAVTMLTLSGCSTADKWKGVIEKSGFTNVAQMDTGGNATFYSATAGSCQIRFVVNEKERRLYATVPGSSSVTNAEFVGDPSLELLKRDKRFAHCFPNAPTEGQPNG